MGQTRALRFYVVRHGETAGNAQMCYLGVSDEPLTEKGLQQARLAAKALSRFPVGLIVSSPLRRAAETAARIQEACGTGLRIDARLAEGSFGNWERRTRDEVLSLGDEDSALLARWVSDPSCSPPGGESIESVQRRVLSLIEELARSGAGAPIVLVSHVGPIKALIAAVLDIPLQSTRRFFLDPGTISVMEWGANPVLRLFNSHAHLGWANPRWE